MNRYVQGTEYLAEDYFNNRQVCQAPVELVMGEEVYVIDQSIIDDETGTYMFVPCIVIRIDESARIKGRKYYMLRAQESVNDEAFNHQEENGVKFYKYLEHTSPFLTKIKEVVEIPTNDSIVTMG